MITRTIQYLTIDTRYQCKKNPTVLPTLKKIHGNVWDNDPLLHNQEGSNNIAPKPPENTKMVLQSNSLTSFSLFLAKNNINVHF